MTNENELIKKINQIKILINSLPANMFKSYYANVYRAYLSSLEEELKFFNSKK